MAAPIAILEIPQDQKIHNMARFVQKYNHNLRQKPVKNADPTRTPLNEELIPLNGKTLVEAYKERMKNSIYDGKSIKPAKNAVLGFEVVLSMGCKEVPEGFDLDAWKKANVEWLKENFGEENVLSAVLHMDETTPHIHAIISPVMTEQIREKRIEEWKEQNAQYLKPDGKYYRDGEEIKPPSMKIGKLNAKEIIGGPQGLSAKQQSYADAMELCGLRPRTKRSRATHEKLNKLHTAVNEQVSYVLPEPQVGESTEDYFKRAKEAFEMRNLQNLAIQRDLEQEIVKMQTRTFEENREKAALESELDEYRTLSELSSMNVKEMERRIRMLARIERGLKEHPDKKLRDDTKRCLTDIVNWAKEQEIIDGDATENTDYREH